MTDQADQHVWHFRYGETDDDLRTAFYVDERSYADPSAAAGAVRSATSALRRLRIVFESELVNARDLPAWLAVPSWEEFKQRHLVEGVPVPVRGRPDEPPFPSGWAAMHEELSKANDSFREELVRITGIAFPGTRVLVDSDRGPLRRSGGSIHPSEEKYGFEIDVSTHIGDLSVGEARERLVTVLREAGWQPAEPGESTLRVTRDQYEIFADVEPGSVYLLGLSPLYSAPDTPASTWITEARPSRPSRADS